MRIRAERLRQSIKGHSRLYTIQMFLVGIILGVLFSVLAAGVIIFGFCKSISISLIVFALLSGSYCFMCYTTGGLENSLLYFLGAWFLYVYFKKPFLNQKGLFCLAFILSLLAWGRMDSVLPFVFIICYGYLFKTDVKFWKRVVIGICGLLPFIRHTILKL